MTGVEGNKVRVIHSGYDRTVPKCRVMPAKVTKYVVEDEEAKVDASPSNEASDEETDDTEK